VWVWTEDLDGQPQGIERTSDAGRHWESATPAGLANQSANHAISGFFALNAQDAWLSFGGVAESAPQSIAFTADGGRKWSVIGRIPSASQCDLQFSSPLVGWCAALTPYTGLDTVSLYLTTSGGRDWKLVSHNSTSALGTLPSTGDGLPVLCNKDLELTGISRGWAEYACNTGMPPLFESVDSGRTWVQRRVPSPGNVNLDYGSYYSGIVRMQGTAGAVPFTVLAPISRTYVYVTRNGGLSWRAVVPPSPRTLWMVDVITPSVWKLVAGNQVVTTDNGGLTWHDGRMNVTFKLFFAYDSPSPPALWFANESDGWIDSSTGLGSLWRTSDGGLRWVRVSVPGTGR
jgi:hypothetical protein